MRRRFLPLFAFVIVLGLAAPAVAAPPPKVPKAPKVNDGLVGAYSYNEQGGYKVTVAFSPCGQDTWRVDASGTTIEYHDPIMQYTVRVQKGGGMTAQIWAHSPRRLDEVLRTMYPFGLADPAVTALQQSAVAYACIV